MVLSIGSNFVFGPKPDAEWQRIIEKLWNEYGIRSSGSKSLDKQKLHELELREAQKQTEIKKKFLTVSENEKEKILAKKNEKKNESELRTCDDSTKGAEILGKQIFQAIQMKQEQDNIDNKRKRNNKYQS